MNIPEYNYERVTIVFEIEEVHAMLGKDEEKLNEFALLLDKYVRHIADAKKIRTKQLLEVSRNAT